MPKIYLMATSILLLSMLACAPEEIKQYRVAKIADSSVAAKAASPSLPFRYTLPKGWESQAVSGMRLASFRMEGGGDVSVVTLPGLGGDLMGNVNRWRGQVGLAPFTDLQDVQNSIAKTKLDGHTAIGLELYAPADKPDKAMRVVLLEKEGVNWFFKLAGSRELVKKQAQAFAAFIASVHFIPGASLPPQTGGDLPPMAGGTSMAPGGPPMTDSSSAASDMNAPGMPSISPQESDTRITYTLPKSWREKPKGAMRVASFEVVKANQSADISVVNLAGDGGGLLSNTNRWRQQLEMAPTDQAGLKNMVKDITVDGHKGYVMALYTGMQGDGMLVALIEEGEQTWFIKMMGPSALIQSQEADFQSFVQSIRFEQKGTQT